MIMLDRNQRQQMLENYGFCIHITGDRDVKLHGHSFLEFTYVEKGEILHTIGQDTRILSKGDYFIVDYGAKHEYKSRGEELSVINLLFYPDFIDRTLDRFDDFEKVVNSYLIRFKYRSLNTSPEGTVFHDEQNRVYDILKSLIYEYEQKEAGHLEYIRSLLAQILIITMRKISKGEDERKQSSIIKEITDSVRKNYTKDLKLSDYAKENNYSLSHISKKFTEEMSMGFTDYLQSIRVENACRLLENTDLTVGDVAEQVGYGDVRFFRKVFKKTIGVTPKTFKKIL